MGELEIRSQKLQEQIIEAEEKFSAQSPLLCKKLYKRKETKQRRGPWSLKGCLRRAKLSAKEMENQMATLQEEVNGLYEKVAENLKVEGALQCTTAGTFSRRNEELAASKSQQLDIEQRLFFKRGSVIGELTPELDLKKASESQVKEDFLALENLLTATKEDLQAKGFGD
ncbi:hypothetical protein NC651_014929 [Populus alba x Populus x berolinensis]|nr:hypothetical protein NC651_014929 [Populus alba x Populus x berolinensis]